MSQMIFKIQMMEQQEGAESRKSSKWKGKWRIGTHFHFGLVEFPRVDEERRREDGRGALFFPLFSPCVYVCVNIGPLLVRYWHRWKTARPILPLLLSLLTDRNGLPLLPPFDNNRLRDTGPGSMDTIWKIFHHDGNLATSLTSSTFPNF